MCHNRVKHFLTSLLLVTTVSPALAQLTANNNRSRANNENSPYSRYGIGEQRNGVNTLLRQMGSISSAYSNPFAVNTDNPASYSSLMLTTYEGGGEGSVRSLDIAGEAYSTGMATLSYLNVGIPLGKKAGMALGLKPFSRVRYNLTDTMSLAGIGNITQSYLGDGSLSYGFIGGGYKLKGFSLGFNFGYLFGTIDQSNSFFTDSTRVYSTAIARSTRVGGIYWKGGAQYEAKLKGKMMLKLGATAAISQQVGVKSNENWFSYMISSSGDPVIFDTAYSAMGTKGEYVLPATYTFGAQLAGSNKWMAGIDFSTTQWSQFRKLGAMDSVSDNAYRIAAGAEYTPDASNMRNYLQRVTYRLGVYYGKDYIRLRNTDINYYAVTAGMSLPFKRTTDRIHLSLEVGSRGTTENGLIKETFAKFGVGLTLNDKWFIKRKYD